jgi:L-fuculose-phosphate aldolase
MSAKEQEIKEQMCIVGQRMYARNMVAANDGNISVRLGNGEFLCTPTGVSKGFMTSDHICRVDAGGNVIEAGGNFSPSSEIKMHIRVYEKRPDVNSVCHAHPSFATAFAIAGIPLEEPIMPEAVLFLGSVPIARYGTPSTMEIPDSIDEFLPYYDAVLLANHGALSWGKDLITAFHKMESVEFYAELLYKAKALGGPKLLTDEQVQRLYRLRKEMKLPGRHPSDAPQAFRTCSK